MKRWFPKKRGAPSEQPDKDALRAEASNPDTPPQRLRELAQRGRLAPLVAANPGTPPVLLGELAHSTQPEVRRAVASNPNAPREALLSLAQQFPDEVCANPVLPLLLLEQPTLFNRLYQGLFALILRLNAPSLLLGALASHPNAVIAAEAALHVNLAGEAGPDWRQQLEETILALGFSSQGGFSQVVEAVAATGSLPSWLLFPLVLHGDNALRAVIGRSYGPHEPALEPFYRAGAAANLCDYATPDPTLELVWLGRLARGSDWAQLLAARHPATPEPLLVQLARGGDPLVRHFCALNPNIGEAALRELASAGGSRERQVRAAEPTTPQAVLRHMADDGARAVRMQLALHPSAEHETLERLASDLDWRVRQVLASRPTLPGGMLERLAADRDRSVVYAVARRPDLSEALLEQLAGHANPVVRHLVARHPAVPEALRARLYAELGVTPLDERPTPPQPRARRAEGQPVDATRSPAAAAAPRPAATFAPATALEMLLRFVSYGYDPLLGALALAHPDCPPEALEKHLADASWIQRYAIISNPRVPRGLLERLSRDVNRFVRAAAREALAQRSAQEETR